MTAQHSDDQQSDDRDAAVPAALVTEHGAPPRPGSVRLRAPAEGECLVRVTAAPIVPLDLLCASGTSYFGPPALPYVPGVQGVGVVASGDLLAAGTRVWFNTDAGMRPGDGSLAAGAVAAEAQAVPVPDDVPDDLAAALGLSAVAAWMALTWRAGLRRGERVLVLGAGGVVGQVAVQVARALGAATVVAASRRESARARAVQLGATAVADLSGGDPDRIEETIKATGGGPFDVVVDPVCGASTTAALRLMAEGGRLVHLGSAGATEAVFASAPVRSRSLSVLGYTNSSLTDAQRAEALGHVFGLAGSGRCSAAHETVPLRDVAAAWVRAAEGETRVVVTP